MGKSDSEDSDFLWDSDDDDKEKIQNAAYPSCLDWRGNAGDTFRDPGGASSSAGPSHTELVVSRYVVMGFPRDMVLKAIDENGEENPDAIVETLLRNSAPEGSPPRCNGVNNDLSSDTSDGILGEFSDLDSDFGNELPDVSSQEKVEPLSKKEMALKRLVDMGYPADEASIAIDRCGPDASDMELTDFICAAQIAREADAYHAAAAAVAATAAVPSPSSDENERKPSPLYSGAPMDKKRRNYEEEESWKRKRERRFEKKFMEEDDDTLRLPKPMIGFGLPGDSRLLSRTLPEAAMGPPYFYYENVALATKGAWHTISRFLYEIEPEFVDSKFFSAAARKRGYIHNLPIHNRTPLVPIPPRTIQEAFPLTKKFWPSWDRRTKLNCLQTCSASAKLTEKIKKSVQHYNDEPPLDVQKYVLDQCKRWNLVWVGKHKVAPLEPDEIETLLGFPKNHTRGGGVSKTERLRGLGNSFQVDTVAYHLSVLRDMFPGGITVLSLFSGIGGAEVALHRLGIPLKNVVSVEISEASRNILRSWWESTDQRGNLIDITDVQDLDSEKLEQLIASFGGFDLIIGGSPCNNLSGSNRLHRDGLEGKESSLFYHYFRILNQVKVIMGKP